MSYNDPNRPAINVEGDDVEVNFSDSSDIYDTEFGMEFPTIDSLYDDVEEDGDFDYFVKAEIEDNTCPY